MNITLNNDPLYVMIVFALIHFYVVYDDSSVICPYCKDSLMFEKSIITAKESSDYGA
jgi:hypothetical protein